MGKPLFCFVNQSLGQHLAYSKGIFFHLDAYVFRRGKKKTLFKKNKKDLKPHSSVKSIDLFILLSMASTVTFHFNYACILKNHDS